LLVTPKVVPTSPILVSLMMAEDGILQHHSLFQRQPVTAAVGIFRGFVPLLHTPEPQTAETKLSGRT
jgi:hypothetical protein